jgi:hypothetical protein
MLPHIRLVSLAKGAETRLCETLKLQRVGVVGLFDDAPGAETLFQLVEEKVAKIENPWSSDGATFIPTRVKWVESVASRQKDGSPRAKKKLKAT